MLNQDTIKEALKAVKYPGYSRDIISFGLVKDVVAAQGAVSVNLQLSSHRPDIAAQLKTECEKVLRALEGVQQVVVSVKMPEAPAGSPAPAAAGQADPWANQSKIAGIEHVLAIASGKGGVGKSTVSVNLACALRYLGARVGLLDCDIYGPSIPLMMGIRERPSVTETDLLIPPQAHGVKLMSMGFLLDDSQPVIWRGPMIMKTVQQFIHQVDWAPLDYLLVDLPPGTGDAQLSLCQTVPLEGGVVVTTPQEASVGVVRKGIAMFEKVNVPILGIVENMSYFTAPNGDRVEIFGHGGGRAECERTGIPFLGEIPIFTQIREGGDAGVPVTVSAPHEAWGQAFIKVAEGIRGRFG